ncbi:DUF2264 domain-containing protein [Nonomuraea sp. FMUSA5-5]|uniref:DUF2264 domain-containing protein n=1 Tax=Nonomuraea composti TaxID=2720023 RepID=A0ABX1B8Y5_9ACTN|nr:DUF2264 domain-containing protein [Nonomuraea sp. FMUSA5-5]NJP94283.1 DUF2264 domain-containing protein [Nonomuraea sp. FMUSA5-5]
MSIPEERPRLRWEAAADHLLASVLPYATDGHAQYRLPGRTSRSGTVSDGLEGYARTFLLAAFRIAGAGGDVPAALLERYAEGLVAGTDPAHPYAWPALTDMAQQLVEAASIALALHETRPWLFDRLSPQQQERVVDWLAGFIGKRTPDNNWVLFRVIVEQFLAGVGGPHEPSEITGGLERIEEWYAGDGWYTDGKGRNYDYYCGWALHLYPSLWARMSGDTARQDLYAGRLRRFLEQYQHFFAADGAPVHQGRSLTYRFATVAPLWLGALTGASPLPPGRTRRIADRVLRHFADHGAPDERGLLTLGWYHEFLPVTQSYSGPASPYWASKAFLGLLLPPDHPAWTAPEEPAPVELADQTLTIPAPGWLLHTTSADGIVRLVNHGTDRDRVQPPDGIPDPHYVKLAYTSHTGPEVGEQAPGVDNHVAVLAPDGTPSLRRLIEPLTTADRFAASAYQDGAVRIVTASVVDGASEIRIHRVTAPAGHQVRDGGHPVAAGSETGLFLWQEGDLALARRRQEGDPALGGRRPEGVPALGGPGREGGLPPVDERPWDGVALTGHWPEDDVALAGLAREGGVAPADERPEGDAALTRLPQGDGLTGADRSAGGLTSAVRALHGFTGTGLVTATNTNAFGRHSATPYALATSHPGGTALYVSLVWLAGVGQEPPAPAVRVEPGDVAVISLPEGRTVTVDMGTDVPTARWQDPAARHP